MHLYFNRNNCFDLVIHLLLRHAIAPFSYIAIDTSILNMPNTIPYNLRIDPYICREELQKSLTPCHTGSSSMTQFPHANYELLMIEIPTFFFLRH